MRIIIFLVCSLFLGACRDVDEKQHPAVNLEELPDNSSKISLNQIADSIRYIALETRDSCLLEGNCSIAGITDKYIYISSTSKIYQFDVHGKFMKEIGALGRGPEEFSNILEVKIYNGKVYVLAWGGEIVIYNENGDFVRKQLSEGNRISNFEIINDSVYISEEKDYKDKGMKLYLVKYVHGKTHSKVLLQQDNLEIKQDYQLSGCFYTLDNIVYYKSLYNDTIYQVDIDLIPRAVKVFTYGKYAAKRDMYEDFKIRKNAINAGYIFNDMFFEAKNYWFAWSMMKDKYYLTVFDKNKNQIIYNQIPDNYPLRENGGIFDNITNMNAYFWPIYSFEDGIRFACLTNASNFSSHTVERLKEMNIVIDENSNPVVSICYFKH